MEPTTIEIIPAFLVFFTVNPSTYAAKGPADLKANANRFNVTKLMFNKAINALIMHIITLLVLVSRITFLSSSSGLIYLLYIHRPN